MEPWMWALVGVVPVVAVGAAYASGAFSTNLSTLNKQLGPYANVTDPAQMKQTVYDEKVAFRGDVDDSYQPSAGKRKHKTKKAKKHNKKTARRK